MELNRDQIVNALEHCEGNGGLCGACHFYWADNCTKRLCTSALALIRELTEEQTDHITMLLAKDVIISDLNNEIANSKADTVREFEARFAMHFGTYTDKDTIKVSDVFKLLSKFAEELLEEG